MASKWKHYDMEYYYFKDLQKLSEDEMKLSFVNGRAVYWLIQIEGSLADQTCHHKVVRS